MIGRLYRWVPDALINHVSRPLPDRFGVYNGVAVKDVPFFTNADYVPEKKRLLWTATRETMQAGDMITFVGGGKGIVPVKAARRDVSVMVIEGARELALQLEQTAGYNDVDIDVVHGVVGSVDNVWGDSSDAREIAPRDIRGDVVVLDCEGAERDILPLPDQRVVLETHPMHGVSESEARELLRGRIENYGRNTHGGKVLVQS